MQFEKMSAAPPTYTRPSKDGGSNDPIETATSYGSLSSPYWGAAIEVDEDVAGANRVTQTLAYDSMGRALEVEDAAGHVFVTSYLPDGEVEEVTVDDDPVVSYTYGTSGTSNGQVILADDLINERWQSFTYGSDTQRDWELGLLVGTAEGKDGSSATYTTAYQYYVAGLRAQATYTTNNGTTKWAYGDYIRGGDPRQGALAFQTMLQQDTSGNPTTNEFHYAYDQSERLVEAAFAQTPNLGSPSNGSYYSTADPAQTRARACPTRSMKVAAAAVSTTAGTRLATGRPAATPPRPCSVRTMPTTPRGSAPARSSSTGVPAVGSPTGRRSTATTRSGDSSRAWITTTVFPAKSKPGVMTLQAIARPRARARGATTISTA